MANLMRLASGAVLMAGLFGGSAATASAADRDDDAHHAVFVQTDDPGGNQIVAYTRNPDGSLSLDRRYDTGGVGLRLQGALADPLASQSSLVYDAQHHLLIGVNGGSHSIYSFQVDGARLSNRAVVDSGGALPVSVAVHDDLVYVVNGDGAGSVSGFHIAGDRLEPIRESARSLGLTAASGPTTFLNTPGQVGFTPDGRQLIVTTKANGSHIDVFHVHADGRLSETPVMNPSQSPAPFAFAFDASGRLVVAEAGTSNLSTYLVRADGGLSPIGTLSDAQAALCWIARADSNNTYYVSNAGSGTVSGYHVDARGRPSLVGSTGIVASPGSGPIDLVTSGGGRFLYVELGGAGSVSEFRTMSDGSLKSIGAVGVQSGIEGIVAI